MYNNVHNYIYYNKLLKYFESIFQTSNKVVKGKKLGSSNFLTDKDILKLKALYGCLGKFFITSLPCLLTNIVLYYTINAMKDPIIADYSFRL